MRTRLVSSKAMRLPLFVVLAATLIAAGGRHLIKKIPVTGDYGWDYLTAGSDSRLE
jgi:hypothetical protein